MPLVQILIDDTVHYKYPVMFNIRITPVYTYILCTQNK